MTKIISEVTLESPWYEVIMKPNEHMLIDLHYIVIAPKHQASLAELCVALDNLVFPFQLNYPCLTKMRDCIYGCINDFAEKSIAWTFEKFLLTALRSDNLEYETEHRLERCILL